MKLFYYRPQQCTNFGDELNLWLWKRLLSEFLDTNKNVIFVGIGTLLHNGFLKKIDESKKIVIFSTGAGSSKSLEIKPSWKIYCVRGPLTAKTLGISEKLAITDGAVLIKNIVKRKKKKKYNFSFMPHWEYGASAWEPICNRLGFSYIDPRFPVNSVLSKIRNSKVLLTSSLHGAIVADVLRVPWTSLITSKSINQFKWRDWCLSVNLEYKPYELPQFKNLSSRKRLISNVYNNLINISPIEFMKERRARRLLNNIVEEAEPQLSKEGEIDRLNTQLELKLKELKKDLLNGAFEN